MKKITIDEPENLDELRFYIEKYRSDIYVREKINDNWGSYSLSELPNHLSKQHIDRFMNEGVIPIRILRD